ncbi:MAG: proton-conducting transporter membrane subunit [Candidatus Dormibacteraceae bacterium]
MADLSLLLVVACVAIPVLAALLCILPVPHRVREAITLGSSVLTAAAIVLLLLRGHLPIRAIDDTVYVDGLSLVVVVVAGLVYLLAGVAAFGYFTHGRPVPDLPLTSWRFHIMFNLFAATVLCVPLTGNLLVLWIAVEATTVTSALLVGLEHSEGALEAAWKYILIASAGLLIGLLGLLLLYTAGARVLGPDYSPTYAELLRVATRLPAHTVLVAFALIVIGFGTKAGLVPMHTWLPDAHSEGPTPVSAMLSGALLGAAMYAIFRVEPIASGALGGAIPHDLLYLFGTLSMVLSGLLALRQVNLKRLYAYSSIEHMGILALGAAFGTPLALYGVMLHLVAHGATKALAFFGAGSVRQRFGSADGRSVTGLNRLMPATAFFLLVGVFAISGVPPAALFRSELTILVGGAGQRMFVFVAVLLIFANLVFLGGLRLVNRMTFSEARPGQPRGEVNRMLLLAMACAVVPAVLLTFYIPPPLNDVFTQAAQVLSR